MSNDILDGFNIPPDMSEEAKQYVLSKVKSTREAALSYCKHMGTDFVSEKAMFILLYHRSMIITFLHLNTSYLMTGSCTNRQ